MRTSAPAVSPIFRSAQQMRLLGVLFGGRGIELSISELASEADVAVATASREAERLEAHGVVISRTSGRSRLVAANWELPWAAPLAAILAQTVGVPALVANALLGVSGVDDAYIFGSWAARYRGEVGPAPHDIDLVVIGDVAHQALRVAFHHLETDIGLEVNPVVVSEDDWHRADDPFVNEIRSRPHVPIPLRNPPSA